MARDESQLFCEPATGSAAGNICCKVSPAGRCATPPARSLASADASAPEAAGAPVPRREHVLQGGSTLATSDTARSPDHFRFRFRPAGVSTAAAAAANWLGRTEQRPIG